MRMSFRWKDVGYRWIFCAGHFPSHGAGSNEHLRVIANALRLAHIAARHHVQLVAIFSEPYRSSNRFAALAKGGEGDIFLAPNGGRDFPGHGKHSNSDNQPVRAGAGLLLAAGACGSSRGQAFDPALSSVLKALHA